MKVAYQGAPGAYSEAAIFEVFGDQAQPIPCETFEEVFQKVEIGEADCGMLPIENSVTGSLHRNYDLLLEHQLAIVGEYPLRVRHCLIGLPDAELKDIRKVISHPQGIAQCEKYLRALGVHTEAVYDTAGSVKMVKESGDPSLAAIASNWAAQIYGMKILQEGIEDNPANYTRFLVLAREPVQPEGEAKTSIVFTLRNIPGALFKALSVFALRDIDLTKIESRPLVGKPWEYLFYIDFRGSITEQRVVNALENLREYALSLRILGSYPRLGNEKSP
ncbi:MAG: prephenate dehydratase [Anaerolineales bacterium]|nr:prephenate dehydratase [Anaerolineales bacterium]MDW8161889.1 prephenate dehydratase [Anaerolineales bacterium]